MDEDFNLDDLDEIASRFDKSLVSVYDNNPPQESSSRIMSIGILGRNIRSSAFASRLILSGFSRPFLCDLNAPQIDPDDQSGYISYESFYQISPSIVLITDNLNGNFEDFFPSNRQQLIIDTRESHSRDIPGACRAFGNLSDEEILHGTQRVPVAVEQFSPSNVIKFIYDLKCFPRGILLIDHYSYQYQSYRPFRNCSLPFLATLFLLILFILLSLIDTSSTVLRTTSSITALTSVTLLALVFLIQPVIQFIRWIYSDSSNFSLKYLEKCLHCRVYFLWYSLSLALIHLLVVLCLKLDLNSSIFIGAFFFGLLTLMMLIILSLITSSWISERLLWKEYHFLLDYLGPLSLLFAGIHLYIYWYVQNSFLNRQFLVLIFSMFVLIFYGIIRVIQWRKT